MTFEAKKFSSMGGHLKAGISFQKYGYLGDVDNLATITTAAYFDPAKFDLNRNDIIEVLDKTVTPWVFRTLVVSANGTGSSVETTELDDGIAYPPGDPDTSVQFNDGGVFAGDSVFTYAKATGTLSVTALADGVIATTQSPLDNSTKIATTAYVDKAVLVEDIWDRDVVNGYIYQKVLTDKVGIGTNTPGAKVDIVGDTDEVQLRVKGNATQTNSLQDWINTTDANMAYISAIGTFGQEGNPALRTGDTQTGGTNCIFIGNTGNITNTASDVYGIGTDSLKNNTSGSFNIGLGRGSLRDNTIGNSNVGLGVGALQKNTEGSANFAIGTDTLSNNLTGVRNVGIGNGVLKGNTNGDNSVGIGDTALTANNGDFNTAIGKSCLTKNTSGFFNTGCGGQALYSNLTGDYNVAVGLNCLFKVLGNNNTGLGTDTGFNNTGSGNVFLGYQAAYNEAGSNKLYIENSNSATPLVYGEFDNDLFRINGHQEIVGNADAIQLLVKGNATQTANRLEIQDSNGVVDVSIDGVGNALWGLANKINFRDSAIGIYSQADTFMDLFADGAVRIGDSSAGAPTNYTNLASDGSVSQTGTARIDWSKYTADSVTITVGTETGTVADLQTAHDGNFLAIQEVAATPGLDVSVDFVSVTAFNWVNITGCYDGSSSHAVAVQVYNWAQTRWDTFDAMQDARCDITTADGYIVGNHSFFVPADTEYIGTGGDAGKVTIRFYHTMSGNSSHDLYLDVVSLQQ